MLSEKGREARQVLIERAAKKLKKEGYEVLREVVLSGKHKVDLLGIKPDYRVAVECQLNISRKTVEEKTKKYYASVSKLVFYVPRIRKAKLEDILGKNEFCEVWTEEIDPVTTISVLSATRVRFLKLLKKSGLPSPDDLICKMMDSWDKKC